MIEPKLKEMFDRQRNSDAFDFDGDTEILVRDILDTAREFDILMTVAKATAAEPGS